MSAVFMQYSLKNISTLFEIFFFYDILKLEIMEKYSSLTN